MPEQGTEVVVGIDNGGTSNNVTVLDRGGEFLLRRMLECRSLVTEGPDRAIPALTGAFTLALEETATPLSAVRAVGLDTPGPASASGVISTRGAVNFLHPAWRGYDIRAALEDALGLPVVYNNDGNAAALYAHHQLLGDDAADRSSISVIVGTGLGGGVVENGQVISGAAGMAGELGHIRIPLDGLLAEDQPMPVCNCGLTGDAESIASLTGITRNLLPYWLDRYPEHPLASAGSAAEAAKLVRGYGEAGDELALTIFGQQAMALGRLLSIAANFTDPHVYFLGGGVVEAEPQFRDWFLATVREHTEMREEQELACTFALVPDLDMAGARGAAIAARETLGLWGVRGAVIVVLAGVSGSGKTTVGELLAARLGCEFADGDAFHPAANVAKMHSGVALTDADRAPWLRAIEAWLDERIAAGTSAVLACSALHRSYRAALLAGRPAVRLVLLEVSHAVAAARLATRRGHFFPPGLLDSQFAALEPPAPGEPVLVVSADRPVGDVTDDLTARLAAGH